MGKAWLSDYGCSLFFAIIEGSRFILSNGYTGSVAAGIRFGIGNVAAGSLFAFYQSAGGGGAGAGTVVVVTKVGAVVAGGAVAADVIIL